MKLVNSPLHALRSFDLRLLATLLVLAAAILPELAFASSGSADESLPFVGVMEKLKDQLSGPFAFSLSVIGIVVAGAVLIFGGDLNGFVRSLVFLVLVIAVITGAGNILQFISGSSAVIASIEMVGPASHVAAQA